MFINYSKGFSLEKNCNKKENWLNQKATKPTMAL